MSEVLSTETKFTPGPWNAFKGISETDDLRCGVTVSRGKTEFLLATIENGAPGDFCETEHANARLIAAAPDLFSALDAMLARYDFGDTLPEDHPINAARAALLKARGGSSNEGE